MRGWRNTAEKELFEISNSMKPYPSVVHAYTSELRPVICLFKPHEFDEVCNRIPPTSQGRATRGTCTWLKCGSELDDDGGARRVNCLPGLQTQVLVGR